LNTQLIVEYLAFLMLMFGECRGEPIAGQFKVAQVVMERNMEMLDVKQFNCFSIRDIKSFEYAKRNNKELKKIVGSVYEKLSFEQMYVWTMIYLSKETIRLLNFDRRMYYMTHDAWKHVRIKYPRWVKKLRVVEKIGGHVFLADKK
jgi:hypothetical protein